MFDFICNWLAENFEPPCSYMIGDEDVADYTLAHYARWCDEHCGSIPASSCWKKYFMTLKKEADEIEIQP